MSYTKRDKRSADKAVEEVIKKVKLECELSEFIKPNESRRYSTPSTSKGRYKCRYCNHTEDISELLDQHVALVHADLKLFRCNYCKFSSNKKLIMKKHAKGHEQKCPFCDFRAVFRKLRQHVRTRHKKKKTFKCTVCINFIASSQSQLEIHIEKIHAEPFACRHCKYSGKILSRLRRHIRKKHPLEPIYECEDCNYNYNTENPSDLGKHIRKTHTDPKFYQCEFEQCEYGTRSSSSFWKHMRDIHSYTKRGNYQCKHCKYRTTYSLNFGKHMNAKHPDTKRIIYQCKHCKYRRTNLVNFRKHMRVKHSEVTTNNPSDTNPDN